MFIIMKKNINKEKILIEKKILVIKKLKKLELITN